MSDGGHFGYWFDDEYGLPAYEYTCDHESDPKAASFTTRGFSRDHWHQLGNDRLNVLAHNDGSLEVVESTRGLQWLCRRNARRRQPGGGIVIIQDESNHNATWCDLFSRKNFSSKYRRIFGCGYYRKTTKRDELTLDHAVFPPLSDDPVIVSELNITNDSKETKNLLIYDYWSVDIRTISQALIYFDEKRKAFSRSAPLNVLGKLVKLVSYGLRIAPEHARDVFSSKLIYYPGYSTLLQTSTLTPVFRGRRRPPKDQPSPHNYYPKTVFLTALKGHPVRTVVSTNELLNKHNRLEIHEQRTRNRIASKDSPCLCLGIRASFKPREKKRFVFLFGYAEEDQIPRLVSKYRHNHSLAAETFPLLTENSQKWAQSLVQFSCGDKKYPWVGRETKWHSYYLRSATLFDDYFENHLFPQGGAYNYLQGLQGVTRDFMMYTVPMIYIDPALAREMLEYTMRLMSPDGRLPYCTHGFGMESGAIVHKSPSDLPLSLLWGLSEYLFATRDFQFLKKKIPFYPKHANRSSTVEERIKLTVNFLLYEIGFGKHGLLRIGDGDWNDGISSMVRNRSSFVKDGESMYNSALALYVLPKVSKLLSQQKENDLAKEIDAARKNLLDASMRSWSGKWFYRGWDGAGKPIGDKNIFLEPLTWLLISGALPKDYASKLVNIVYTKLDKPSRFGQYLVYPPVRTLLNYLERGWDVNGGTWYAMNFLLSWGYSKYDREKAWNALVKNSMRTHARVFPDIWYGIWSGPDALNATYASRPGETYYHLFTPTTDFPVMNLNLHANFLLALLKIAGVEPAIDGLTISPAVPLMQYELITPILNLKISANEIQGSYSRLTPSAFKLRLRLPREWRNNNLECYLDKDKVDQIMFEEPDFVEVKVLSKAKRFGFKFLSRKT